MTTTRRTQRDRAQRALRLRAQRATWQEVADACGYRSRQAAQVAVRRLLDSIAPDPDTDRALSTEGLRLLEGRLWRQYARADAAGDTDTMVKISKEIRSLSAEGSRLNGLYRPERQEIDVTVGRSRAEILAAEESRFLASLADRRTDPSLPESRRDNDARNINGHSGSTATEGADMEAIDAEAIDAEVIE